MAQGNLDPFTKPRTFVQTGAAELPELDHWQQMGEEEAVVAADMTRRSELSGGTPVVREFEQMWHEWIGTKYCVSIINGTAAFYSAHF